MFRKSIPSDLENFQFYSNCDLEQDHSFDGLHFQGKIRTKVAFTDHAYLRGKNTRVI